MRNFVSRFLSGLCCVTLFSACDNLCAQSVTDTSAHDHSPVIVYSRPVIERLPVKVVAPVDLKVSRDGRIYVADRGARCVFCIDQDGTVGVPIEKLDGIQRLHVDEDQSLFILTSVEAESAIVQVTPDGLTVKLAEIHSPASSFVRISRDEFLVAGHDLKRVSTSGSVVIQRTFGAELADLALNAAGYPEALTSNGQVFAVLEDGEFLPRGFVPKNARRLLAGQDGQLAVIAPSENQKAGIFSVVSEPTMKHTVVAHVPSGTLAAGFDALGNLCLANPDLRAVTKVTSHFEIDCPHCGRKVPMHFLSEPPAVESRSF